MNNRVIGVKKSKFTGSTSIPSDAYFDFVSNSRNIRIPYTDFLNSLGVSGSIVQTGNPLAVPILDKQGPVNAIRNLEAGEGVQIEITPQNGIKLSLDFGRDLNVDTVQDMIEGQFYFSGDRVRTRGFSVIGDKGENDYEIGTFGAPDGVFIISLDFGGLQARRINQVDIELDNVQAMIDCLFLYPGDSVNTLGYTTIGDGGGNDYEIVATATGVDDGGSFIDLSGSGNQAKGLFISGIPTARQFGAVGDGLADDTSAIQNLFNFAKTTRINSGSYLITTALTISGNEYNISGDGFENTKLITSGSTGDILSVSNSGSPVQRFSIKGIRFTNPGNVISGTQLTLENVIDGSVTDCAFYGWWNGIHSIGSNRIFYERLVFTQQFRSSGKGNDAILFTGTTASGVSSDNHISNNQVIDGSSGAFGFRASIHVQSSDGLYVENSHFIGGDYDILINPDDIEKNDTISSILINNSYLDKTESSGCLVIQGTASTAYRDIQVNNCILRDAETRGVVLNPTNANLIIFSSCQIRSSNLSGIYAVGSSTNNVIIDACIFNDNNTNNAALEADIFARGDSWTISGNQFIGGGAAGGAINLTSTSTNCSARDNNVIGSTAGTRFSNTGTGNRRSEFIGLSLRSNGTATINNPNTSVTVNHGLSFTPNINQVRAQLNNDAVGVTRYFITNATSTSFDINVNAAPTTSALFIWEVDIET